MAETPKMSVGRPLKKPSCSDFCRVCGCNFNTYYGDFKRRVSTENLFEIPKRAGVEKSRLADLGITCEQSSSLSSRVCAKCGTEIRNAIGLSRFLRGSLLFQPPPPPPPKSVVEVEHLQGNVLVRHAPASVHCEMLFVFVASRQGLKKTISPVLVSRIR